MDDFQFFPPDFVIAGLPQSDCSVLLIASTHVHSACLEIDHRHSDPGWLMGPDPGWLLGLDIQLTARLGRLTLVHGSTYAEAFEKLMGTWQPPEHAGRPAVEQARAAINPPAI